MKAYWRGAVLGMALMISAAAFAVEPVPADSLIANAIDDNTGIAEIPEMMEAPAPEDAGSEPATIPKNHVEEHHGVTNYPIEENVIPTGVNDQMTDIKIDMEEKQPEAKAEKETGEQEKSRPEPGSPLCKTLRCSKEDAAE